jgi:hypothetical protein
MEAIESAAHCIDVNVQRAENGSAFQELACLPRASESDFVSKTGRLATLLSEAQTVGSVKPGVGMFLSGTGDQDGAEVSWVAVIKADPDQALIQKYERGQISLEYVANLILGAHQRLLKVAFLVEEIASAGSDLRDPTDFNIRVYDHLMSNTGRKEASRYFYQTFLGCKIAATAPRQTRTFFEKTKDFLDKTFTDPEDRITYRGHLVSYLKSPRPQFSVKDFSESYLPRPLWRDYRKLMKEAGLPSHAVSKDNGLIGTRLRRSTMRFSSKLMIVGPPDLLASAVRIEETLSKDGSEWTKLLIQGRLERSP